MNFVAFGLLVVSILVILWLVCYNPPHEDMKSGKRLNAKLIKKHYENLVSGMNWTATSRGLNMPNDYYEPVIKTVHEMERVNTGDIYLDQQ